MDDIVAEGPREGLVEHGYITPSGEVDWEYQRQSAVQAVHYLMGVTGVSDQITIKPQISVGAVKSDSEASLKRRATTDAQKISVNVHGAVVTLTGSVDSWSERDLARHSARGSPGVRNVVDSIAVGY